MLTLLQLIGVYDVELLIKMSLIVYTQLITNQMA
jgi:hypothetical protein